MKETPRIYYTEWSSKNQKTHTHTICHTCIKLNPFAPSVIQSHSKTGIYIWLLHEWWSWKHFIDQEENCPASVSRRIIYSWAREISSISARTNFYQLNRIIICLFEKKNQQHLVRHPHSTLAQEYIFVQRNFLRARGIFFVSLFFFFFKY